MPDNTLTQDDLARAGREAGRSMIAAAQAVTGEAPVAIEAADFMKLGKLLMALARIAERCGGEDCFSRPVNGVRSWVPAQTLEDNARQIRSLTRDNEALRDALARIAETRPGLLARRSENLQTIARTALGSMRDASYPSGEGRGGRG